MSESLHTTPTVFAGYAAAIASALESKGLSSVEILRRAGIDYKPTSNPLDRLPYTTTNKLVDISLEKTEDPYFGLVIARHIYRHLHALSHATMASNNLYDMMGRFQRFFRLMSQEGKLIIEKSGKEIKVSLDPIIPFRGEYMDPLLSFFVYYMRLATKQSFSPIKVELSRSTPPDGQEPFTKFYKCPVTFNQKLDTFYFDLNEMMTPLESANPDLAQILDQVLIDYMTRLDKSDIVWRLENLLIEILPRGNISASRVAEKLNMAPSTLALKLSDKGTGFQELLENIRRKLSNSYLHQQDLSVTEITFLLGYSDTSSYSRACKRWTGLSPRQFKESLKGQLPACDRMEEQHENG